MNFVCLLLLLSTTSHLPLTKLHQSRIQDMTQFEEQAGSSQRSTPTPTHHNISFSLRALIPSRDAGLIIGKSGKNVQEIREQTEARIRVSEMVPGASDRVLTVYGSTAAIANVCA